MVVIDANDDNVLEHYGVARRSGRYPWGSHGWGEGPHDEHGVPRHVTFFQNVDQLKKEGLSEAEIAKAMGLESTTRLRAVRTIALNEQRQAQVTQAQRLKDTGMSNVAIGIEMGAPESTVRNWLAPGAKDRGDNLTAISNMLKTEADRHVYLDVGRGVESKLGVSKEKLNVALQMAKEEGYNVHPLNILQIGTGKDTKAKILVPPGVTQKDVFLNQDKIRLPSVFSDDGGRNFENTKPKPPIAISPKRLTVRFKEDGGDHADGVIYVRPGVPDLSLGQKRYAQVRIQVGPDKYLKGMAMYKNDLPDGTDLLFNTNKPRTANKMDALKPLTGDPDLPFGSVTRPVDDPPTSAMNLVNEEGQWNEWSRSLSSQVLSKQSPVLARNQLAMKYEQVRRQYDEITQLTNPTVRKKLLEDFADSSDAAAVHLEAAALPRQNWHVILPIESLKPTEIYAPGYRNGETVALIRFPHGGTFEIPELTVNNKHSESKSLLGDARDAVGIHHTVAQRLSGADFDGDTVLVIPNNSKKLRTSAALEALKSFDPMVYKLPDDSGIPVISSKRKQQEMGNVSNLITDMTIKGAPHEHIARAVKHSMVVIDAEKGLNYKQSAIDNGIPQLKKLYQGTARSGASTLISKAGSRTYVDERKARPAALGGPIDPVTGEKRYVPTERRTKSGDVRKQRSQKLAETTDAFSLTSKPTPTPIEHLYAEHSNKLKALANSARLDVLKTPRLKYSPLAKRTYADEVKSLDAKLSLAKQKAPLERQALLVTKAQVRAIKEANPHLERDTIKKIEFSELAKARARLQSGKDETRIHFTQREWDAIQAGAISNNQLKQMLDKADMEIVKKLATPQRKVLMSSVKTTRAKDMLALGYTRAQVADQLGVSLSTLDNAVHGRE
jgi:hypothetical protein